MTAELELDWIRQRDKQVLRKTDAEEIIKELLNKEPVKEAARQGNIRIAIINGKAGAKIAINDRTIATFDKKIKNTPNISVDVRLVSKNSSEKYQLLLRDRDQERLYHKLTSVNKLKNKPENNLPSVSYWSKKLDRKLMVKADKRAQNNFHDSITNIINQALLDKRVVRYARNSPVDIRISSGKLKIYSTTITSNRALYVIDTKVSRWTPDVTIKATFKGEQISQDRFKDLEKGLSFELRLNNESKARLIAGEMGDISCYDNLGHYQKFDKVVRNKHKLKNNSLLTEDWINKQAEVYIREFIHEYQNSPEVQSKFNSKVIPFQRDRRFDSLASDILPESIYKLTEKAKAFISEIKRISEKYLTLKTTREVIYDARNSELKPQGLEQTKTKKIPAPPERKLITHKSQEQLPPPPKREAINYKVKKKLTAPEQSSYNQALNKTEPQKEEIRIPKFLERDLQVKVQATVGQNRAVRVISSLDLSLIEKRCLGNNRTVYITPPNFFRDNVKSTQPSEKQRENKPQKNREREH